MVMRGILFPRGNNIMTVDQVIAHYKTQTKAADAIGVTQSAFSNWKKRGKIPPLQQLKFQRKSRGRLQPDRGIL